MQQQQQQTTVEVIPSFSFMDVAMEELEKEAVESMLENETIISLLLFAFVLSVCYKVCDSFGVYGGDDDLVKLVAELKSTEEELLLVLEELQNVDTGLQNVVEQPEPQGVAEETEKLSARQNRYDELKEENQHFQQQLTHLTQELCVEERDEVTTRSAITQELCDMTTVESHLRAERKLFNKVEWEEIVVKHHDTVQEVNGYEATAIELKSGMALEAELNFLSSLSCMKIIEQTQTRVRLRLAPPTPIHIKDNYITNNNNNENNNNNNNDNNNNNNNNKNNKGDVVEAAVCVDVLLERTSDDINVVEVSPACCCDLTKFMQQKLKGKTRGTEHQQWALRQVLSTAAVRTLS
eukprot:GHVS01096117.1.p1 GENE.GHVS01096117.1~~GHVS01096117.1.p1  ORF type:complete len:351 (+),score=114.21 GHVS01096117.1:55-1107(+)